jgi:hypothetical protein
MVGITSRSVPRRSVTKDTVTFEMGDSHFPFESDTQNRVIVCLTCQYAMIPTQAKTHLQIYHKRLTLQQRRDIVSKIEDTAELARVPYDVVYPGPCTPLVFYLPVYLDGLKCTKTSSQGDVYSYICRTLHPMQEHCKRKHDWVNRYKRGGDVRTRQGLDGEPCLQAVFQGQGLAAVFRSGLPGHISGSREANLPKA